MDPTILVFLLQDGITNGLIYVLLAVATIVTFSATRITFIPQGDFVAIGALTFASFTTGKVPGTVRLVLVLSVIATAMELYAGLRRGRGMGTFLRAAVAALPGVLALALTAVPAKGLPYGLATVAMLVLVVPIGPLLYRIVYQPLADASVLVLLIVSAAVHYVLAGLTLYFFGPEGVRIAPLVKHDFEFGDILVSGQALAILVATIVILVALTLFFGRTLVGKALRAAASNRVGSELVGISVPLAGMLALALAALVGAVSGLLIGPVVTMFYDTGFGIGLRGFVGAIFGGLTSYPLAGLGALFIGITESFAAFYASQYKDTIVFLLVIPVLVVLSLRHRTVEE